MLDIAGLSPGVGNVPDLLNAVIYVAEGDLANATQSAISAIPLVGIFSTTTKIVKTNVKSKKTVKGAGGAKPKTKNITTSDLVSGFLVTKPKNAPNPKKWLNKKGSINIDESGTWKYTNINGQSVKYSNGYPDFKEAGLIKQDIDIGKFDNYVLDFKKADYLAPNGPETP